MYFAHHIHTFTLQTTMENKETEYINFQYEGRPATLQLEELKKAFILLRAISHPLRQEIIHLLDKEGSKRVTGVFIALRIEQSVASQQLGILRDAGIVSPKRTGKFVSYSLNESRLQQIIKLATNLAVTDKKEITEK